MAELIIVTGPPGAGKSTVARELMQEFEPSSLVVGDVFFGFLGRGAIAPWLPEAHAQNQVVLQAAAVATGLFVVGGQTVVYDGVVGPWALPDFAAAAGLAQLGYVVLMPSQERCLRRVATRVGHGFTDATATRRMYRDFASSGVQERHVITDPPDDPRATVALILERLSDLSLRYAPSGSGTTTSPPATPHQALGPLLRG